MEFMMKVLLIHLRHYTEVLFPVLAEQYHWSLRFPHQFKLALYRAILSPGNPVPYRLSRQQLKQVLSLCKKIKSEPTLFPTLVGV